MASFVYDLALQGYLQGSFDMLTATVKCALVQISGSGTPYTANQATDQFLNVIPSGAVAARSSALTSKSIVDGIFGAANTVFSSVVFSNPVGAYVIYIDTGSDATSPLLAYVDSTTCSGLPFTPAPGANVGLSFATTGFQIFQL